MTAFNVLRILEEDSSTEAFLRTVSTLGNPISNLTKSSFLLDWREQAWPLTCSVIKAKQTPSISCHYHREEGEDGGGRSKRGKWKEEKTELEAEDGGKKRLGEEEVRAGWKMERKKTEEGMGGGGGDEWRAGARKRVRWREEGGRERGKQKERK